MRQDERFMRRALALARLGGRAVAPNPKVGAVIVKNGRVIGEGYHRFFGGPHAETVAIRSVKNKTDLAGATLYVTLEPCDRFGKTPPCARAIERAGIGRVVIGSRDPSLPSYNIAFITKLRINKLRIKRSLCSNNQGAIKSQSNNKDRVTNYELLRGPVAKNCARLNRFFFKWVTTGLPYITVKVAVSKDGFVAGPKGRPVKITSAAQDRQVHQLRAEHQAILVGSGTVLADDPHLGARYGAGQDPLRIILDSDLRTPKDAKVYRDSNVLLVCLGTTPVRRIQAYAEPGIPVVGVSGRGRLNLRVLFRRLGRRGISSVLVEPGPTLYRELKRLKLVDEEILLRGAACIGQGVAL